MPPTRKSLPLILACLLLSAPAAPTSAPAFGPPELQGLLQRFVDAEYDRVFRHLGDERDFDHGHVLFDRATRKPVAILYHTQELAQDEAPGSDFGYLDAGARNWLQWIDSGAIENAARYERSEYPDTPAWALFKLQDLPGFRSRHTIVDAMLDPARLGFEPGPAQQWTFTRTDCSLPAKSGRIAVRLPNQGQDVCLSLDIL